LAETEAAGNFTQLRHVPIPNRRRNANLHANARAIGNSTDAFHFEPVIRVAGVAIEKIGPTPLPIRDEKIHEAIVVEIAPGRARRITAVVHDASSGDLRERAIAIVAIERIVLATGVGGENVEIPVVIVVGPLHDF
jgi:hypothetical protein